MQNARRLTSTFGPGLRPARALQLGLLLGLSLGLQLGLYVGPAVSVAIASPELEDPVDGLVSTTLENGLRVHLLEDHHTPVVAFQVWVNAGSADESFYTGIAHLFEHMMFKGSKHVGDEVHAQLITERGGSINAYTSRDVTVYHEDVTTETLPLVIDLEAERFGNLVISPEILEPERAVVLEERRLRTEDSPDGLAFEALAALAWDAHPYRWPTIGWRSNVEQVPVEECRKFFDTYYAANNLSVVVVGDFESEPTLARIRKRFGKLEPAKVIPRNTTAVGRQRGERRAEIRFDVQSPMLMAGWHTPATGHPDGEALDVASTILSGGRTGRLYRKLVYEQEKALYAVGGYMEMNRAGLFYAQAQARPGVSIDEVERLFMAEIDAVAKNGVSEEEVARARQQMEVSLVDGLGTNHALAARIGREMVAYGRVRPLEERIAAIRAVTPAEVQRVVQTYLRPESRTVIHVVAPPPTEVAAQAAPSADAGAGTKAEGGAR
ncbi:MAG: insulinase family protein [Deltaproteobacteria bacterium]|nr:insulinase family protein [Deltaproteobacteria bacterium]